VCTVCIHCTCHWYTTLAPHTHTHTPTEIHRGLQRYTEIHRYARTLTHTHTEWERHKHTYCSLARTTYTHTHTATPSTQRYTQKYTEIHRGTQPYFTRCIYTPHTYKSIVVLFYLHHPNCELYVYMVYTFIYSILFNRLLYSNCVSKTKQRNNVILRYICMYLEILCFV
jgi:hypothetical protein